ncbi:hypothetical protein [Egicoccus sp. AB-alg2]|uniref:hypothetical protein n=1 Tax=Egicoccus sp. AB-alg2 TaxID=3242693 RepID=UPI00359E0848
MSKHDRDNRAHLETAVKAALSLVPGIGGALATIVGDELDRRRQSGRETAEFIIKGVADGDVLLQRLREHEQLSSIFAAAVEAGMRTTLREKRRAMAVAVSRAVLDEALVDEAQLIVAVLSDLDVPHLRALEEFRRRVDAADPTRTIAHHRSIESQTSGLSSPIEAALVRHGCIYSQSTAVLGGGITHWGVTYFGRMVLDELRNHSDSGDDDAA